MRSPQKSNRARGRGSRKSNGGNNVNRVYESNGPEGKVRGTAQQIIDKYQSLARDAQTSSDRVNAENFLQHAEHYLRVHNLALGQQQERRDQQGSGDQDDDDQPQVSEGPRSEPVRAGDGGSVSGMQTIDAREDDGPELIVTPEEMASTRSRKRRNGRGNAESDGSDTEPAESRAD